jgi:PIN domain nuclease of toxin-antitoxin system
VKYLLDTHALAWWLLNDPRLSRKAFGVIADPGNEIIASAVAAWEAANKFRIGKWPDAQILATDFKSAVTAERFSILDVTHQHASVGGLLAGPHRDPFDRLLAAQALIERMPILSGDSVFADFGVEAVW